MLSVMRSEEKTYHDTKHLFISTQIEIESLKVVCISTGRSETTYEIFDSNDNFLGRRSFTCWLFPILGLFTKALTDDLNVLFDGKLEYKDVGPIAEIAVGKCESRYGNSIEGGDCILHIKHQSFEE